MGVTYIAPAGTVTSPAKLITKNITDNGTYDAADDLANGYSSVTVNVSGGGGGGDLSTAEVTVITPEDYGGCDLYGAFINPTGWEGLENPANFTASQAYVSSGTENYTLILYKGSALLMLSESEATVTTSGAITFNEDFGIYVVTGDCTITIS